MLFIKAPIDLDLKEAFRIIPSNSSPPGSITVTQANNTINPLRQQPLEIPND